MSVKIHKLEYIQSDSNQFFEFTVQFSVQKDDESFFQRLQKWIPTMYVNDPKVHDEETSKLKMVFVPTPEHKGYSRIDWIGPEVTDDWKRGFIHGLDCLDHKDEVFTFHEFFTITPVTLALVEEIKKFQTNSDHTADSPHATIAPQYFSNLLEALFLFWD